MSFRGDPTNPEIVVYGKDFGRRPAPNTAGWNLESGAVRADTWAHRLRLWQQAMAWEPHTALVRGLHAVRRLHGPDVTKYTDREIVYRFGSLYAQHYEQRDGHGHGDYELEQGDRVDINVNGAVLTTRVHYPG